MTNLAKLYSSLLNKTNEFAQELSPALLKNFVVVSCAIIVKETVNLNKLKNQIGILIANKETFPESHYRRLTRYFDNPMAKRKLWKWLIVWMIDHIKRWDGRSISQYLTLDTTSWQLGQQLLQLLVLSLVYRSVSLPCFGSI